MRLYDWLWYDLHIWLSILSSQDFSMKKYIIMCVWLCVIGWVFAQQLIDDVITPASTEVVTDLSLVNWLIDSSIVIWGAWSWAPFIVKLTAFFIRMTALLAVSAMMLAGISYIRAMWNEKEETEVFDWIKRIIFGLVLASTSTTIILIIISLVSQRSIGWLF